MAKLFNHLKIITLKKLLVHTKKSLKIFFFIWTDSKTTIDGYSQKLLAKITEYKKNLQIALDLHVDLGWERISKSKTTIADINATIDCWIPELNISESETLQKLKLQELSNDLKSIIDLVEV